MVLEEKNNVRGYRLEPAYVGALYFNPLDPLDRRYAAILPGRF